MDMKSNQVEDLKDKKNRGGRPTDYTKVLYAGYKLHCNVCGDKVDVFVIEAPASGLEVSKALKRQEIEVTIPNHKGHEWEYISWLKGVSKAEYDKWVEKHGN